ncbi:hypothetical protein M422DRAFT_262738 [Sphaerobolus stellatus SS14]|uniref:Zn(2)-C6 fungal-type domain-containing protein n=1 Tax=Sphaerobolus stellatus (strain SS14) TaxID=990650 RepID=A0A0C9TX59_SPHS4|nr:hypothetical protein M422DRAFT_262738 [Sphaerobolus stellatus SS14]
MTDAPIPAWKVSTDVIWMGEILSADPRRTVRGFVPDKKFDAPAPTLVFNDPYEDDEDCLNKVKKYWRAHDKERMLREARYKELLDAEVQATERRKADENARALEKAKEEAAAREKEVPRTPRKVTPKKSQTEVQSESEGEEDEEKPQCVYCVKKNIPCVPQAGKKVCIACGKRKMKCEFFDKTAWAVMDGSKQISDSVRELVGLERRREASRLEGVWYDLQRFLVEVEQRAAMDSAAADAKLLQLLELKSKGVEIPEDLEKRIRMERGLVQDTLKEHTADLTERMDALQKHTAWTGNGLPSVNQESTPVPPAAVQGTKRKNDNEGNHVERGKKKKKKKMVETGEGSSTLR